MNPFYLHRIIALLLGFIVLTYNINTVIILTDFMINQKVIAATLCVQKEAPKGCNGKCQLRKMLRANSKKTPSGIPLGQEENYVV